jgi:hypothetical protein
MTDQRIASSIQHKLMLKLLEFDFTLEYKKGKENMVAYALSRKQHTSLAISVVTPKWITEVEQSYSQDNVCKPLLEHLLLDNQSKPNYSLNAGIIRYKGKIYVGNVPPLKKQLLTALHSSAVGGHSGHKATYQRIKRIFYWPGVKVDV